MLPDRVEHAGQARAAEQRRRSAADEHRLHVGRRAKQVGGQLQLGAQRDQPAVGIRAAQLGGRVGVEVAVAAAGRAERHVDVDAERPARRRRKAGQVELPFGPSSDQFRRGLLLTLSANLRPVRAYVGVRGTIGHVTAARIFPQRVSLVARRHVDFKRVCTCCCLP